MSQDIIDDMLNFGLDPNLKCSGYKDIKGEKGRYTDADCHTLRMMYAYTLGSIRKKEEGPCIFHCDGRDCFSICLGTNLLTYKSSKDGDYISFTLRKNAT